MDSTTERRLLAPSERRKSSLSNMNPHRPSFMRRHPWVHRILQTEKIEKMARSTFVSNIVRVFVYICSAYEEVRDSGKIYLTRKHAWSLRPIKLPNATPNLLGQLFPDICITEIVFMIAVCGTILAIGAGHHYGTAAGMTVGLLTVTIPRFSPLSVLLGVTHQDCIKYHRWFGTLLLGVMLLHGGIEGFFTRCTDRNPKKCFMGGHGNRTGAAVVVIYTCLWLTTFEIIRRRLYEAFFFTHIILAISFYVGIVYHKRACFSLIVVGLGLYIVDRIRRHLRSRILCHIAEVKSIPGTDAVRLFITATSLPHHDPGQHAYLRFPSISSIEWHPLSLTSGPGVVVEGSKFSIGQRQCSIEFCARIASSSHMPNNAVNEPAISNLPDEAGLANNLKITGVRNYGLCPPSANWSGRLSQLLQGSPVYVDGPYGRLSIPLNKCNRLALVGGGVGITPLISFAKHFVYCARDTDEYTNANLTSRASHTGDILHTSSLVGETVNEDTCTSKDETDDEVVVIQESNLDIAIDFDSSDSGDDDFEFQNMEFASVRLGDQTNLCSLRHIQTVDLCWTVRQRECLSWFWEDIHHMREYSRGANADADACVDTTMPRLSQPRNFNCSLYVTGTGQEEEQSPNDKYSSVSSGRPSIRQYLLSIASDEISRGFGSVSPSVVGVVVCGPNSLVEEVRVVALSQTWEGGRVVFMVHQERFEK
eukprot:CFRG3113T1